MSNTFSCAEVVFMIHFIFSNNSLYTCGHEEVICTCVLLDMFHTGSVGSVKVFIYIHIAPQQEGHPGHCLCFCASTCCAEVGFFRRGEMKGKNVSGRKAFCVSFNKEIDSAFVCVCMCVCVRERDASWRRHGRVTSLNTHQAC